MGKKLWRGAVMCSVMPVHRDALLPSFASGHGFRCGHVANPQYPQRHIIPCMRPPHGVETIGKAQARIRRGMFQCKLSIHSVIFCFCHTLEVFYLTAGKAVHLPGLEKKSVPALVSFEPGSSLRPGQLARTQKHQLKLMSAGHYF